MTKNMTILKRGEQDSCLVVNIPEEPKYVLFNYDIPLYKTTLLILKKNFYTS